MRHFNLAGLLCVGVFGVLAPHIPALAETAITEQEAHAIGVDATFTFIRS